MSAYFPLPLVLLTFGAMLAIISSCTELAGVMYPCENY